jgi:hypothetical protein
MNPDFTFHRLNSLAGIITGDYLFCHLASLLTHWRRVRRLRMIDAVAEQQPLYVLE